MSYFDSPSQRQAATIAHKAHGRQRRICPPLGGQILFSSLVVVGELVGGLVGKLVDFLPGVVNFLPTLKFVSVDFLPTLIFVSVPFCYRLISFCRQIFLPTDRDLYRSHHYLYAVFI